MTRPDLLLEGGGSRTWLGLCDGDSLLATTTGPSTNPRSVGTEHAARTLTTLLTDLLDGAATPIGHLIAAHGAASTPSTARRFADLLTAAWTTTGAAPANTWVTNDITAPLLTGDPVCVVIAGTGTGYAARHGDRFARASGLEWPLSDEGGGHDLAVAGLRAAIRDLDGRGPDTSLTAAAHAWAALDTRLPAADALFDAVYTPHAKPRIAVFAETVLAAASAGDTVACALVEHAADELATGVHAVRDAVGLTAGTGTLILAGSLLTGTPELAERLRTRLDPRTMIRHEPDHATAMLALRRSWLAVPRLLTGTAIPSHIVSGAS